MPDAGPDPEQVAHRPADRMAARIRDAHAGRGGLLVVGLDGRSGSGKSTMAAALTRVLVGHGIGVTVVEGDEFYCGGSAATWDRRAAAENADRVMDWRRQRAVLEALRDRGRAEWHPFDWESDDWDTDVVPLSDRPVRATASDVVLLEGAYSCRPELHDLLDLRALLDVPADVRRRQLLGREGEHFRADWEVRWSAAEDHYFASVMPPVRFDVVVGHR